MPAVRVLAPGAVFASTAADQNGRIAHIRVCKTMRPERNKAGYSRQWKFSVSIVKK